MISNCPHCQVALKFSDSQRAKLEKALDALEPGKKLTIKCPQCKEAIQLKAEQITQDASTANLSPPPPPDLEWLKTGHFEEDEKVEDVPMALVMHENQADLVKVKAAMESVGYRVLTADSVQHAIEHMRFINFACVAFHTGFEPVPLEESLFHQYMRDMPMERRRYMFYILIGPDFHSLYDIQALAYSANLVVAEKDLQYFDIMLRKAIPAYEELFGPILEEFSAYGKR